MNNFNNGQISEEEFDRLRNELFDKVDEETDIFKKKRPRHPTDEPNPVRRPGRTSEDVGSYWGAYTGSFMSRMY